jgi:hypothetical protein
MRHGRTLSVPREEEEATTLSGGRRTKKYFGFFCKQYWKNVGSKLFV